MSWMRLVKLAGLVKLGEVSWVLGVLFVKIRVHQGSAREKFETPTFHYFQTED